MFLNLLTTREQAVIIWVIIFIIWALYHKKIRSSIYHLIKVFLQKKIVIIFSIMVLYIALVIYLFSLIDLWNFILLKSTIFWVAGSAVVLFVNLNESIKCQNHFRKIALDNLKFLLIIIFIVNFYTFHLIIELVILPLLFSLFAISAYSGTSGRRHRGHPDTKPGYPDTL
jgi:hypothetical protein